MKLIIREEVIEPPTNLTCFRDVTLYSTIFLGFDVLVETNEDDLDAYYKFLRKNYCHDFVKAMVTRKEKESGLRMNVKREADVNIVVDGIHYNNYTDVLAKLASFRTSP